MPKDSKKTSGADRIDEAVSRGVSQIYPSPEALRAALSGGKRLKIYLGVDPTGPHLHLGHLTNLLTLKRFQDLGNEIIFLIGDFTARIGDPTDKLAARKPLTAAEVKKNLGSFKSQASRIIRFSGTNAAKVAFNAAWLAKMNLEKVLALAHRATVQQLIERDMFQDRLKAGKPIGLHEFLYPLLQGYDSVAMGVDAEVGGTDQTFNMLMGRTLLKEYKNKEKFVIATKLLEHPKTGKKLMNKSEGGMINLDDASEDMFGKVMALDDASMFPVAEFSTEMPLARIAEIRAAVDSGKMNPKDAKLEIASWVVRTVCGEKMAGKAQEKWQDLFSNKDFSVDLPEVITASGTTAAFIMEQSGVVKSKSEARRLAEQGAVKVDESIIKDPKAQITVEEGQIVKIGKKNFFRIKLKKNQDK